MKGRTALALIAAGAGLSLVAAVAPVEAAPSSASSSAGAASAAALTASGPFSADADVSMLTVELPALSPSIIPQTNVDLGRSSAAADNDADLDNAKAGDQRSAAVAATTGSTSILGAAVGIAENRASAPASEANEDVVLPLDLSPLLNLPVIRTTALANWLSDTECVSSDTPMSYADQALADLTLLGGEALGGGAVADLNTADGEGAVDAEVSTFLASINGPGADQRAVQSRIKTDVTSLDVLADLAGPGALIHADVVQNPNWVVSASGLPGGASVTGPDPAVNVSIAGTPLINLSSGNAPVPAELTELNLLDLLDMDLTTDLVADLLLDVLGPAAQPLIDALTGPIVDAVETVLETLSPVAMLSIPTEIVEAADGTSASVEGALLRVELLAPSAPSTPLDPLVDDVLNAILGALGADTGEPLLAVNVAPYEGNVVAPAGGIDCGSDNPLRELNKHASALEVAPGGTFEYNIAVPNRGPCVVTDVKVTDVITGPAGFEVLTTEPPATSNQNGTLTFDLGDIAVNETKNITITVKVPANAPSGSSFDDVVQVEGNCNDKPITEDDTLLDTPTVKTDFTGECTVQNSNKDASHIQVFPGQTFSYYVHAFNSGGEPCTNVKIVDTLDARLTFVSCNKNCTHSGDQVTWTIPTLGGGSSAILSVVVQVEEDATGELANTAIISPEGKPPKTVTTTGPVIGPTSIPKDPISPSRGSLPKTGLEIPLVLTLLTGALGYGLLHLRRRADAAALS